jgi:4-alpha-glucanotransferase
MQGRMNLPGSPSGHWRWRWRFRQEELTPAMSVRLKQLVETYER